MATNNRHAAGGGQRPITIFGPDFPFPFDDWIEHPAGLGCIPAERHGAEVAIVGAGIPVLVLVHDLHALINNRRQLPREPDPRPSSSTVPNCALPTQRPRTCTEVRDTCERCLGTSPWCARGDSLHMRTPAWSGGLVTDELLGGGDHPFQLGPNRWQPSGRRWRGRRSEHRTASVSPVAARKATCARCCEG